MGAFFAYTIYSGVFLLFLFLFYKVLISNEKQISLNRIVLLSCYVLAFVAWPLNQIEWRSSSDASPALIGMELPMLQEVGNEEVNPSRLPQILIWIYIVGAAGVLLTSLFSLVKIILYLRKGKLLRCEGYNLIIMSNDKTAPFSIGRYIVMSVSDYHAMSDTVLAHEEAHIGCRHYLDLIIAQIVCVVLWYNPAAWLMRDELKLLHEYQADNVVLDSGVDAKTYQMLLIRKTVGNRFQTLANSLNHSKLKNRIAMMQKEKSGGIRRMRVLALVIAPMVAFGVMNLPAVASDLKGLEDVSLTHDPVAVVGVGNAAKGEGAVQKEIPEYHGVAVPSDSAEAVDPENLEWEPTVMVDPENLEWEPTVAVDEGLVADTPVYVDGVKYEKSLDDLDPKKIESIQVYRRGDNGYPNGAIFIKLKK